MEEKNIISINVMLQFIDFYKKNLEQKYEKKVETSDVDTVQEFVREQKLKPLKQTLETINRTGTPEQPITIEKVSIIDEKQNPGIDIKIETDYGTNTYSKFNEHMEIEDGHIIPRTTFVETVENETSGMIIDSFSTVRDQIHNTFNSDIELFTSHSYLLIETNELDTLFKFNLNHQFLIYKGIEKPITEMPKKLINHLGISLENIPSDMIKYYEPFIKQQVIKQQDDGLVKKLIRKLGKN